MRSGWYIPRLYGSRRRRRRRRRLAGGRRRIVGDRRGVDVGRGAGTLAARAEEQVPDRLLQLFERAGGDDGGLAGVEVLLHDGEPAAPLFEELPEFQSQLLAIELRLGHGTPGAAAGRAGGDRARVATAGGTEDLDRGGAL